MYVYVVYIHICGDVPYYTGFISQCVVLETPMEPQRMMGALLEGLPQCTTYTYMYMYVHVDMEEEGTQ